MTSRFLSICGLLSILLTVGCLSSKDQTARAIVYPDSRAYRKRTVLFRFNEEQAHQLLLEAVKERRRVQFSYRPLFLAGSEYCFGVPEKTRVPLAGFYVDGLTGRIVYRKSNSYIKGRGLSKTLPENPFQGEETIREGERF
jgi:hypothetical protein